MLRPVEDLVNVGVGTEDIQGWQPGGLGTLV